MKAKGIEQTWENGNESIARMLMKKGERGHLALSAGLPILPIDAGQGSVLRGTMQIWKESGQHPRIWLAPPLFGNKIESVSNESNHKTMCQRHSKWKWDRGVLSVLSPVIILLLLQHQPVTGSTQVHLECHIAACIPHHLLIPPVGAGFITGTVFSTLYASKQA